MALLPDWSIPLTFSRLVLISEPMGSNPADDNLRDLLGTGSDMILAAESDVRH